MKKLTKAAAAAILGFALATFVVGVYEIAYHLIGARK